MVRKKSEINDNFWQPLRKVGLYIFGENINSIENFLNLHIEDYEDRQDNSNEYRAFRPINDQDIIIHTFEDIIYAVTYRNSFFLDNSNFIGRDKNSFINELRLNFGEIEVEQDTENILHRDGSIIISYEVQDLGLEFSTDEFGIIIHITADEGPENIADLKF